MKRLLFSFLFVLLAISGWAQTTFTQGDFTYTVTDEDAKTVSIAEAEAATLTGAITIPSSVTYETVTYTVTSIADYGFGSNEDITEVTIPNTVTSIGEGAFYGCDGLTTITLPSTLTTIGNSAFFQCSSLASFSVPGSVTTIGAQVFDYCSIPTFTFEASNTAITYNSEIPCTNHLYLYRDIIKDGALTDGKVKSLTIGANVTTINENMFQGCTYLSSIDFSEATGLTSIGDYAFYNCGSYVPTEPGEDPVPNLTTIDLSNTKVTSIGEGAFYNCSELTTITLPSTLTTIGNYAFWNCSSLTSFSVPGSVTTIGAQVFDYCSIPTFTFEASNTAVTCNAVIPCTDHLFLYRDVDRGGYELTTGAIKALTIGANVTTINENMFQGCHYLSSIDFSEATGLTSIGDYAFYGCGNYVPEPGEDPVPNLTDIDLSNTKVTSIGQSAFNSCSKLETITLPSTLTSIGDWAFQDCRSLVSFSLPGSVTTISSAAFYNCSIPTFTFEASNTTLTWNTIVPCSGHLYLYRNIDLVDGYMPHGLKAVTIGENVTGIGTMFSEAVQLENVYVPWLSSPITIADGAFCETTYTDATLWIPGGTGDIYDAADGWKNFTHKDFASFVVSITSSAHGTLSVADISSTNNETAITLIDRETDAVFTVTPATGYKLSTFTVNSEAKTPTEGKYTVSNLLADQTVVATFTPITYTLNYDLAGGSVASANPATYTIETETFTLNNPTKTGYTFAGWKLNGVGEAMMSVTIAKGSTGHLAYTATWTPITYNITYKLNGGTATNPATYNIETATFTLTNPTKTGYTFTGWKQDGEGDAMMTVTITQGTTGALAYTATWQVNQYTITFDSNGGTAIDAIKQDYGTEVEAPATPTRTGYTFAGWLPEVPATIPAENTTCVAQWTINQYTITFNTAGGSVIAPITQDYATDVVAPANPTRKGYTFAGWDKEIPTTIPAEDVTITATWTPVNYTIDYDLAGGYVDGINPTSYTIESAPITLINPTKDGYDFAGWTGTELDAATKNVIIATGNTGDGSYTATWTKKTYNVSITGASVTADNMTPEYGESVIITIEAGEDRTLNTLTVNGVDVTENVVDGQQYTIENVTSNVTVVATFNSTKEYITLAQGVGTFSCSQDLNFTDSELKAYIAAGYNKAKNQVLLVHVYDVPAGTGLYLKGEAGKTYKIPYTTSQSYYVNMLKANLTAGSIAKTDGNMSNFLLSNEDGVYKFCAPSESATLGAQKAYLQVPTSFVPVPDAARAISIAFEDDETTNINDFELFTNSNDRLYNLKGQRIEKAGRGIYIKNGKKVVLK